VKTDSLADLRQRHRGQVIGPDDAGYDPARITFNGMIDRRPALIARPLDVADVVAAVGYAVEAELPIAVRGGGHSVAGHCIGEGGVVIDLRLMHDVVVDADARVATCGGGSLWEDLDPPCLRHGLATPGGTFGDTGVAGLTLGGGIGHLIGLHGLTLDNLLAATVVTAEGEVLRASEDENTDLFWGLRGGGGNFGVAASFEFEVHPIDSILGGIVAYPLSDALRVLAPYQEITADPPDELVSFFALVHAPDGSGNKIVAMPVCYCGEISAGEALLAPVRSAGTPAVDLIGPMPYAAINTMLDGAYPRGARNYWRSAFLKELNEELLGVLVDAFERVPSPMTSILIEHFHGAATRVDPTATAYAHREPGYNLAITGEWLDPADDDANIGWIRATFDAVAPYTADDVFLNYLGGDEAERVHTAYGPNWERLVTLKRRWDPDNVFRLNQNIPPSG
jgi:FAD/FMN-containing dehydrogenase